MPTSLGQNTHPDSDVGGRIKQESELDPMQGIQDFQAGIKQGYTDDEGLKQESDADSDLAGADTSDVGARNFVSVNHGLGQSPGAGSLASDAQTSEDEGEEGDCMDEDSEMEQDEEGEEGEELPGGQDCGFHAEEWENDLLKRIFTQPGRSCCEAGVLRKAFCGSADLTQKPEDDPYSTAPTDPDSPCHGILSLESVFLYTSPYAHAMRALGLDSFVGSAHLELTTDGDRELEGTPISLIHPDQVFQAITRLGRPHRHTAEHGQWCGLTTAEDEATAKNWNLPFNQDRLERMEDVVEWDLGTHEGKVLDDKKIDLNVILSARSIRNFAPPWNFSQE